MMTTRLSLNTILLLIVALVTQACANDVVIYEKTSAFGPVIVTQDADGSRTLRFERGGARQSFARPGDPDHLELAYAKMVMAGVALGGEPRRMLVVGLGGGTVPMFLHKHYPAATIDAVDINPDVVNVAREYFGFTEDRRMRAHVDDGRGFIEKTRQPYDVIILDAYGSDSVPAHLTTQEFLQAVRRAAAPSGVVVSNLWGRTSNRLYDAMVRTYQEVFDDLYVLEVSGTGNVILLALPRRQALSRDELAQLARRVSNEKKFRFDLGAMVSLGYVQPREKNPGVSVLRDPAPSGK